MFPVFRRKCKGVVLISSIVEKGQRITLVYFFQTVTFKYYNGMFFYKLDMENKIYIISLMHNRLTEITAFMLKRHAQKYQEDF